MDRNFSAFRFCLHNVIIRQWPTAISRFLFPAVGLAENEQNMALILSPNLFSMHINLGCYGQPQVEFSDVTRILILCIFFRLHKEIWIHNTDDPSLNFNHYIIFFKKTTLFQVRNGYFCFLSTSAAVISRRNPLLDHTYTTKCMGQRFPYVESKRPSSLTFKSLAVSLRTIRLNIQKLYMALILRWVFCTDIRTNSDYFPIRR